MSGSAPSQLEQLKDFVNGLKRHTKGRRAVHIQMSKMLRHHQEPAFRREAAAFIKPIVDKFPTSRNFALSNHDLMLVMHEATLDDIEPVLAKIRKHFKSDPLIASLDPIQGQSDDFTIWYDLEKNFSDFVENIELMLKAEKAGLEMTKVFESEPSQPVKTFESNMATGNYSRVAKPVPNIRAVKIQRTDAYIDAPITPLDAETTLKLEKFILVMDLGAFVRSQNIIAIVGKGEPATAMIEKSVVAEEVVGQLIKGVDLTSNLWLRGYLDDVIADRLMLCEPELKNKNSLASIVPLTTRAILGPHFATFEQGHKHMDRSAIILEISLMDILADSKRFEAAQNKARRAGYKLAVGQIDPYALSILDLSLLKVDFFKVSWRPTTASWLEGQNRQKFKDALHNIGLPRVIISNCVSDEAITTMRKLGAILFEGPAVGNYKP